MGIDISTDNSAPISFTGLAAHNGEEAELASAHTQ